jgi:hypothetical protein
MKIQTADGVNLYSKGARNNVEPTGRGAARNFVWGGAAI